MLFVHINTKCCANMYIRKNTIYYQYILSPCNLAGFDVPYWFCKLLTCSRYRNQNHNGETSMDTHDNMMGHSVQQHDSSERNNNNNNNTNKTGQNFKTSVKTRNKNRGKKDKEKEDSLEDITLVLTEINDAGVDEFITNKQGNRVKVERYNSKKRLHKTFNPKGPMGTIDEDASRVSMMSMTPTQRHDVIPGTTLNRGRSSEESTKLSLDDQAKDIDLQNMNFKGQPLFKRKKPKAKETRASLKERVKQDKENKKIQTVMESDKNEKYVKKIANREDTYAPHVDGVSIIEKSMDDNENAVDRLVGQEEKKDDGDDGGGKNNSGLKPILVPESTTDNDLTSEETTPKIHGPISLVIWELEGVLATSMKSIASKTGKDIAFTDLPKMLLAFGGVERLDKLHIYLTDVVCDRSDRVCFMITDELSQTGYKVKCASDVCISNNSCIVVSRYCQPGCVIVVAFVCVFLGLFVYFFALNRF